MQADEKGLPELAFHPVTPDRWQDLEGLFGTRGACAGCWCMYWRMKRSEWEKARGAGTRTALKAMVDGGDPPGILAYAGGRAAGWCAVAPTEAFPALARSRNLRSVDSQPVWSIVCFFVARPFRRRGLTAELLRAAVAHARSMGGSIVEGYPSRPSKATADAWLYMGVASAFEKAGFVEVARPSERVSVMRCSPE